MARPIGWDPPGPVPPDELLREAVNAVARDLRTTRNEDLNVVFSSSQLSETSDAFLDGYLGSWLDDCPPFTARGWILDARGWASAGIEAYDYEDLVAVTVRVADAIQDEVAEATYEAWPRCPRCSATHPLAPLARDGGAVWSCASAAVALPIGGLPGT